MKKNNLLVIVLIMAFSAQAFASFELARNTSPRGISLGNALVGDVDPINGILYNPASVAYSKQLQVQGIFGFNYLGLNTAKFNTMDYTAIVPFTYKFKYEPVFKNLVFGLAFNRLSLKETGSLYDASDDFSYYEQMMTVSFGKKLENIFAYGTLLSLGANINIFSLGLSQNMDTTGNTGYFQNYNPMSFGLDIGATYYLNKVMVLGGTFQNIIQPNVKFNSDAKNQLLPTYQLGLSWHFNKIFFMNNVLALAQMTFMNWEDPNDIRKKPGEYHFGLEFYEFEKLLAIRLGYATSQYGSRSGYSIPSAGFGITKAFGPHEFQFDLGYQLSMPFGDNAFVGNYGSPVISLTYNWAWPQSYFEFDTKKREELQQIEEMKKQYQDEQKKEGAQKEELKKDESKTGSIESANDSPDVVMKKANQDQNTKLLELFTGYTKKRDSILADNKKQKEAAQKQSADLDKQITTENDKLAKASNKDKAKITITLNDLNKKKEDLVKDTNKKDADYAASLIDLKTTTSKSMKDIQANYETVKKKFAGKTTANFKEEAPSVDLKVFVKDLEKTK